MSEELSRNIFHASFLLEVDFEEQFESVPITMLSVLDACSDIKEDKSVPSETPA